MSDLRQAPILRRIESEGADRADRPPVETMCWRTFFCNEKGHNVGTPDRMGPGGFVSRVSLPRFGFLDQGAAR